MKRTLFLSVFALSLALASGPAHGAPDAAPAAAKVEKKEAAKAPAASQPAAAPAAVPESKAAPAAEGEATQSWWKSLLVDLISLALAIFVPVLSALGFLLLRKLGVKVDLETLDRLALQAATYAEKKAATALGEGKPKSTGAQKEEWAWDLVKSVDAKLAGSEKAKEKLRALILAKIPEAESRVAASAKPAAPPAPGTEG